MSAPNPEDPSARLGKSLLLAAWITGVALLVLFFQQFLDAEHNPNRDLQPAAGPDGRAQVVLQRNRVGHYLAPGHINGTPATFLVDTGASAVALPLPLARTLRLPLRPGGTSKTANGLVDTWTTRLDSVEIGGLHARNVYAIVLPNMPGQEVLLGMTFLRRVELVQRGDTLTLRSPR